MNLLSWLPRGASDAEIRAEVWRLGVRHRGEPLSGALGELKAGNLTAQRAKLLQACVRKLRRSTPAIRP